MSNLFVVATSDASSNIMDSTITGLLQDKHTLLEMNIGFFREFAEGHQVIRRVDSNANSDAIIKEGQSNALKETYRQRLVDGRLPQAICDARPLTDAKKLDITKTRKIRAYPTIPITLSNRKFMVFSAILVINRAPL